MKNIDVSVLTFLIETNEEVNISKISKKIDIDYKNVYLSVKRLSKKELISLKKFGRSTKCVLNKKVHPLIFETEYKRRKKLLKNKNLKILYKKLNQLNFPFIALIFGSYAKNGADKSSDIDLLVLCEKKNNKKIKELISILPLDIHLTNFTFDNFLDMARSKEFTVVSEAIKNNIILIGIENYYRLMGNVG